MRKFMGFFRSRSSRVLRVAILALFLGVSMPAPAHADISLGSLLSGITSLFSGLVNSLMGLFDRSNTSTIMGLQVLWQGQVRIAEYTAMQQNLTARSQVLATASQRFRPITNYQCAVLTDMRTELGRQMAGSSAAEMVSNAMAVLGRRVDSGNVLDKNKLDTLFCRLGVIGVQPGGCQTAADIRVLGADTNFAKAIGNKTCIPWDDTEVINEINRIAGFTTTQEFENYTPASENLRLAMVAVLYVRQVIGLHCPWPMGSQGSTLQGAEANAEMREELVSRYAAAQALEEALKYKLCVKENTMLPNCRELDKNMINVIQNALPSARTPGQRPFYFPPDGYCLSKVQADIAQDERDRIGQRTEYTPGEDIQRDLVFYNAALVRGQRSEAHVRMMATAGRDVAAMKRGPICPRTTRETTSNDSIEIDELKQIVRELTKALRETHQNLPRALDVKAKTPPKTPPEAKVRDGNEAALPPLRQDFETLQ
jgi:hypothetical protein